MENIDLNQIRHPIHKRHLNSKQKAQSELSYFLLDHNGLKQTLDWIAIIVVTVFSAFIFAYGFRTFISPEGKHALISGGASGVGQVILRIMQLCGFTGSEKNIQSILYFLINVPICIIAFKFIGKKFTFVTLLNVALTSALINALPEEWMQLFSTIVENDDYISRALFAGICTGLSAGSAFLIGSSTGGIDVIAFAIAEKKSTNVGIYSAILNCCTVILYSVFNSIHIQSTNEIYLALYTVIYFFTSSKVTDLINIKNKKTEIQINTSNKEMAAQLLRSFPHGCTIVAAKGGYTLQDRLLIYTIVSSNEVKKVISFVKEIDPRCFINTITSYQVYGNFYIKPLK